MTQVFSQKIKITENIPRFFQASGASRFFQRVFRRFIPSVHCNGLIGFMKLEKVEFIVKVHFRCRHDTFRILPKPLIKKLSPSHRVMKENPTKRPNIPPKSATKTNVQNCNLQVIDKRSPFMNQDPRILAFPVLVIRCTRGCASACLNAFLHFQIGIFLGGHVSNWGFLKSKVAVKITISP